MHLRIRSGQFCALAKESKFQIWLSGKSTELYQELMEHLKQSTSCKSNIVKMNSIKDGLDKLDLGDDLFEFLKKNYPLTISEIDEKTSKEFEYVQYTNALDKLDDVSVFKYYNPKILTFPQKIVFKNANRIALEESVKEFLVDKIDYDYIIINDLAYVEYFHYKYRGEAEKIPKSMRELFKYKGRNP